MISRCTKQTVNLSRPMCINQKRHVALVGGGSYMWTGDGGYNDDGRSTSPYDDAKVNPRLNKSSIMKRIQFRHNWDYEGHSKFEIADFVFVQAADPEDPFDEHPLPFYMEYQTHDKEHYETQLRTGVWWNPQDRIQKFRDIHAWEHCVTWADYATKDNHHHKAARMFLAYPDILWPIENKYEYELGQIENFISMLKHIPHARHVEPQLVREARDLGRTRVTQLKERFGVSGIDFLATGEETKRQRTQKTMYKSPETGPMVYPFHGERSSHIHRLPTESGKAIEKWREENPQQYAAAQSTDQAKLAQWISEFEQKVEETWVMSEVDKFKWVKMFFVDAMGDKHRVYGMVGETLMEVCRRWEVPLDGYCWGGDRMELSGDGPRCQFCQIDIAPRWIHTLPPMDHREEPFSWHFRVLTPTSRLACQICVTEQMDGFTASIPQMEPSQGADVH